ncbi:hypothetical protein [Methylomonas koyamae]|uniref:hypothetical protein n=1 Tax=Methylomonas koyamae TaxID=702114 RepID=UPI001127C8B1|nr:hypothetical protein [Methylomonas koyamae]TPQ24948.1 hypothetical protein C2U68_17380 [Methylomonas koyamae]
MIGAALFQRVAPALVFVLLLAGVWWHGYLTADRLRVELAATVKASSDAALTIAMTDNQRQRQRLVALNQHIQQTDTAYAKVIEDLARDNRARITSVQFHRALCPDAAAKGPAATSGSNADDSPTGIFLSGVEKRHEEADDVARVAVACQAYVAGLKAEGFIDDR